MRSKPGQRIGFNETHENTLLFNDGEFICLFE